MSQILFIAAIVSLGSLIGSFLGVYKRCSPKVVYNFLGFAAGIMLAISFFNLIPQSLTVSNFGTVILGAVFGAVIIYFVKKIIPHIHASRHLHESSLQKIENTATLIIIGIFIHNIPEGLAIGVSSLENFHLSLTIALAIAIHDIPESLCTSLPYYSATGRRLKSFLVSASTVIPTLFGIFVAYFFLGEVSPGLIGFIMAATAGVMVFIAADELIPVSFGKLGNKIFLPLGVGALTVVLLSFIAV
jgi:ZIP family zinc transporter